METESLKATLRYNRFISHHNAWQTRTWYEVIATMLFQSTTIFYFLYSEADVTHIILEIKFC